MKRLYLPCLLALLAGACSEPTSVEQQITSEIRAMEAELEGGERLNFMSHISDNFRGQGGSMNRQDLRAYVVLQFNRYKNLEARLLPITVTEVNEYEATAQFRALLTGGANWIPENGQLYEFRTNWRLEDGDWMLAAAYWEPVAVGDLLD